MSVGRTVTGGSGSRLPHARKHLFDVDLDVFLLGWGRQAGAWGSSLREVGREDTHGFYSSPQGSGRVQL